MTPLPRFLLALMLLVLSVESSRAQSVPARKADPDTCIARHWDYLGCALLAGGVTNLADVERPVQRELRLWSIHGNMMPEQLVIVRADSNGVTGEVLHLWRRSPTNDSVVLLRCAGTPRLNDAAGYCVAPLGYPVDWTALMTSLDSVGVTDLPSRPLPPDPCRIETLDATGGRRMVSCITSLSGPTRTLEYRAANVYWRYTMVSVADPKSPLLPRDAAIVRLLACTGLPTTVPMCAARPRE